MPMAGQKMTSKKWLKIGRELLSSLLFPLRCPVCDDILGPEEIEKGIHSACESKLFPIYGAVCMHCGRPIGDKISKNTEYKLHMEQKDESKYEIGITREYCHDCVGKGYSRKSFVTQAKALYLYKGAIKMSMYRFKYSNKREYAEFFAKQAAKSYSTWMKHIGIETIVPVPLYVAKQRRRGYNQAECFARALAKHLEVPVDIDMVYRVVNTIPQKGLSQTERKKNLEKAFRKGKSTIRYRCVLIVDDIYTTGSTAEAVAQELMRLGTERVYLLTICIGE